MADATFRGGDRMAGISLSSGSGTMFLPKVTMVDQSGSAVSSGNDASPTTTQTAVLPAGTDRSGTTSGTAGTATTLAIANASRRGLNVQNVSAGNIGINETGGTASIGAAGTYTLSPQASAIIRTNRAISVVGASASLVYTATEW